MYKWCWCIFFVSLSLSTWGQQLVHIKEARILKHVVLEGEYTASRGATIALDWSYADTTNTTNLRWELELINQSVSVFRTIVSPNENAISERVSNTLTFQIPYRLVELEEGIHTISLRIGLAQQSTTLYTQKIKWQQPPVFDVMLEMQQATITPDSNYNPIGLYNNAPDPIWLVQVHEEQKKGMVDRNSFQPLAFQTATTMTAFDSLIIGVYNDDPADKKWLGQYALSPNSDSIRQVLQQPLLPQVAASKIYIRKLLRDKVSSQFELLENQVHQGIRGVMLSFAYELPYYYRKKNIAIQLKDYQNQSLQNYLTLAESRQQIDNKIIGNYRYFVPYHHLQNTTTIGLTLSANKNTIQQHTTTPLVIPKTVDEVSVSQTAGHRREGVSGILYRLDYQLPELHPEAELQVRFPSIEPAVLSKISYWSANFPNDIKQGDEGKIPTLQQQTIFVFLPYFVAPSNIQLQPQLWLKTNHIPAIKMATFYTKPYGRPLQLSDISIQTSLVQSEVFEGISGERFEFGIEIPEYYHSKGDFILTILADGKEATLPIFINDDCYASRIQPVRNQRKLSVFVPYRAMEEGKKYQVILQAKSEDFALSEARQELFHNPRQQLQTKGLYIQQLHTPEWKKVVVKIGIRNFKNLNRTYPHLGYQIIAQDSLSGNYKMRLANANNKQYRLTADADDELVIWIKEEGKPDDSAQLIRTSLAALAANDQQLEIKNEGVIKLLILKVVDKK